MASDDAAGDPLRAAASAACLLPRTLGPAASAASPFRALLDGPLKRSKELVDQARLTMKEHPNIQKLYQGDGEKFSAAVNGKNNQQGRRPALDRKRARFSLKALSSNTVQNVDFSILMNIEDPDEYFSTLDKLEKADKEIKKLRGEVPSETTNQYRALESKRRPGMSRTRRKSTHSYKFSAHADAPDVIEAPSSQLGTITEPQFTQDDKPASVTERTKLPVDSSSRQCDIPNISTRLDSFAEKDKSSIWDNLMSDFKNLDESEEENLLREKLHLKEISIGKVCLPDLFNIPGDSSVIITAVQENPVSGHSPERPVLGGYHDRILQWEKNIFGGDILKDKSDLSKDDESDVSPETVKSKRQVVLTAGEASAAREIPSPSLKSPDHVLEPELSILNSVLRDEREPGYSSLGKCIHSEIATEKDASSRHTVTLEEVGVPVDHPIIEKTNHESEVSSRHLEGHSTGMLGSTPRRNASALHDEDDHFEHQGGVGANELLHDKSIHPPEIPPEDIDPYNQSHIRDGEIQIQAVDLSNKHSLSKDSKQKIARKGKTKKQPPRKRKKAADEVSYPLGVPSANRDSEAQPISQDTNFEQCTVGTSDPHSPNKVKGGKEAQRRNTRKDARKSLTGFGLAWQCGVRRSTRIRSRPLEDWRGERFLYGRIHDTMATVIGIKSYSPSTDGKTAMRVKSFLPEQYADIVAQAAKY